MVNKKAIQKICITLIMFVAVSHTIFHIVVYGTGVSGVYETGISGFSIGKIDLGDEFKSNHPSLPPISAIIVGAEWILLGMFLVFASINNKLSMDESLIEFKIGAIGEHEKTKTELDLLYDALKENKKLSLTSVSKSFGISKELAMEWCKILESSNLATIETPRFSDPEVSLIQNG